jgi:hypothetical protein
MGGSALQEVFSRTKLYILSLLRLCLDLMKPPPMVPKNPMLMVALEQERRNPGRGAATFTSTSGYALAFSA